MKGLIIVGALAFLCSCGAPIPPQEVKVPAVLQDSLPNQDTVPTIVLSEEVPETNDSVIAQIVVTQNGIHAFDSKSGFNSLNPMADVSLTIYKGSLEIKEGGKIPPEFNPPCELLSDGRIRVKEGATLSFLARYYGTTVTNLLRCNPNIENRDHVHAGSILLLNCKCYECPR